MITRHTQTTALDPTKAVSAPIEPNSNLRILRTRLDNNYDHTIFFANTSTQSSYFISKTVFNLEKYYYIRSQRAVRVEIEADRLYNCNYIMYQNTAFGNKWFYAFITDIKYINNDMSEIYFEMDDIQTWAISPTECIYQPSMVERCHEETDELDGNLVPENLDCYNYTTFELDDSTVWKNYVICIWSTVDKNYQDVGGQEMGGLYSGLKALLFLTSTDANAWLQGLAEEGKTSAIVSMCMLPADIDITQQYPVQRHTYGRYTSDIDGYKPKNKKLFTYPYNYLYVTNNEGQNREFHWELFLAKGTAEFNLYFFPSPASEACFVPAYRNMQRNFDERLTVTNFPQVPYSTDAYAEWLAYNQTKQTYNLGKEVLRMSASVFQVASGVASIPATGGAGAVFASGEVIGGAKNLVSSFERLLGLWQENHSASIAPPQAGGNSSSGALSASYKFKGFQVFNTYITAENAERIDNFFTLYGYKQLKLMPIKRDARPHWTYIRTVDANIYGNMPAPALQHIKDIFNKGITWWKNGDELGNYNLDNSV